MSAVFSRIIFKHGKDIYCPKVRDELNDGGSVSLNMRTVDPLMGRSMSALVGPIF